MTLSSSLTRFLAGMEYPATRDDLLREGIRDGLPAGDRALLESLPEHNYSAAWHVRILLTQHPLSESLLPPLVSA